MYRLIWNQIKKMQVARKTKQRIFIAVNVVLYMLLGIAAWYLFGVKRFPGSIRWFLCFVGYPAVLFGFAGSIFALFKLDQ